MARRWTANEGHCTLILLFTACLAALISAIATRASIPWLKRQGALAAENRRTMHRGLVPKGGGIPLLAAAALTVALTAMPLPPATPDWRIIATAALFAALLSWRDDRGHLSPFIRLPAHLGIAALVVSNLAADALIFQNLLPLWADRVAATVALAWMMNLYNFMDGINGLAGSQTVSISLGYCMLSAVAGVALSYAPLAAALLGASIGFLIWNARSTPLLFLGDVGSVPLGLLTGVLMLDLAQRGLWIPALILPGYFIADSTITLVARIARGERPWEAHRSHAYQRAAIALNSHLAVVARVTLANVLLIAAAYLAVTRPLAGGLCAAVILIVLFANLNRAARSRSSDTDPSQR